MFIFLSFMCSLSLIEVPDINLMQINNLFAILLFSFGLSQIDSTCEVKSNDLLRAVLDRKNCAIFF
uniref:Uncharacterized protein MANES_03G159500 n=1 Tax=Rhizophora mucronata TaxID=61149 RepID=A0A2P2MLD1_RHIMU